MEIQVGHAEFRIRHSEFEILPLYYSPPCREVQKNCSLYKSSITQTLTCQSTVRRGAALDIHVLDLIVVCLTTGAATRAYQPRSSEKRGGQYCRL